MRWRRITAGTAARCSADKPRSLSPSTPRSISANNRARSALIFANRSSIFSLAIVASTVIARSIARSNTRISARTSSPPVAKFVRDISFMGQRQGVRADRGRGGGRAGAAGACPGLKSFFQGGTYFFTPAIISAVSALAALVLSLLLLWFLIYLLHLWGGER